MKIPDDEKIAKECEDLLTDIIELAKKIRIQYGTSAEEFVEEILKIQNPSNDRFIMWLLKYTESYSDAYFKIGRIREIPQLELKKMVVFCIDKLILMRLSEEEISNEIGNENNDIFILRKLVMIYAEHYVWERRSRRWCNMIMKKTYDIDLELCNILYEEISTKCEEIWKVLLAEKISTMEEEINEIKVNQEKQVNTIFS